MAEPIENYAVNFLRRVGDFLVVSRPWEHQHAVFLQGRCVFTSNRRCEALTFAELQTI